MNWLPYTPLAFLKEQRLAAQNCWRNKLDFWVKKSYSKFGLLIDVINESLCDLAGIWICDPLSNAKLS